MDHYERKQSRMTTAEIQQNLDMIRLAYRNRNMEPLNRRLMADMPWLTLGMVIGVVIAAFLYL